MIVLWFLILLPYAFSQTNYGVMMTVKDSNGDTFLRTVVPTLFLGQVNPSKSPSGRATCFDIADYKIPSMASHLDWQNARFSDGWEIVFSGVFSENTQTSPYSFVFDAPEGTNLKVDQFGDDSSSETSFNFTEISDPSYSPYALHNVGTIGTPISFSMTLSATKATPFCFMMFIVQSGHSRLISNGKEYQGLSDYFESLFTLKDGDNPIEMNPKLIGQFQNDDDARSKIDALLTSILGCTSNPIYKLENYSIEIPVQATQQIIDGQTLSLRPCFYSGILCRLTVNDVEDVEYEIIGIDLENAGCDDSYTPSQTESISYSTIFSALEYVPALEYLILNELPFKSANKNFYQILSVAGPFLSVFECRECFLTTPLLENFPNWFTSPSLSIIDIAFTETSLEVMEPRLAVSLASSPNLDTYFLNDTFIQWIENFPEGVYLNLAGHPLQGYFPSSLQNMLESNKLVLNREYVWCVDSLTLRNSISITNCTNRHISSIHPPQFRPELNEFTFQVNFASKPGYTCNITSLQWAIAVFNDFEIDLVSSSTPSKTIANYSGEAFSLTINLTEAKLWDPPFDFSLFTSGEEVELLVQAADSHVNDFKCAETFSFKMPSSGICPIGQFRKVNQYDQNFCEKCPKNRYSPQPNQTLCLSCPLRAITNEDGSSSLSNCLCPQRTYGLANLHQECRPCPRHSAIRCSDDNQEFPIVANGYWYDSYTSEEVFTCIPAEACIGNLGLGSTQCANGYTSNRCALCEKGEYYRMGGKCHKCPSTSAFLIVMLFIIVFALCFAVLFTSRPSPYKYSSLGVAFTWTQIVSLFGSLPMQWPTVVQSTYDSASFVNFNFELFAPECSSSVDFRAKWFLKIFIPVFLCCALFITFHLQKIVLRRKLFQVSFVITKERLWYGSTLIFMWSFTLLCKTTFQPLNCVKNNGIWVMYHDSSTECFTQEYYRDWVPYMLLSFLVYIVGIPSFLAFKLVSAKKSGALDTLEFQERFGALTVPYRDSFYWFEIFNMTRKAVIVVFLDFFFVMSTQFIQIFIILFVFFIFLVLQIKWVPYKLRTNNTLTIVWILTAMYCLFTAVVFPNDAVSDTEKGHFGRIVTFAFAYACAHSLYALLYEERAMRYLKSENAYDMGYHLQFVKEAKSVLKVLFPLSFGHLMKMLPLEGIKATRIFVGESKKIAQKMRTKSIAFSDESNLNASDGQSDQILTKKREIQEITVTIEESKADYSDES